MTSLVADVAPYAQICHMVSVVYNSFAKTLLQKCWIMFIFVGHAHTELGVPMDPRVRYIISFRFTLNQFKFVKSFRTKSNGAFNQFTGHDCRLNHL